MHDSYLWATGQLTGRCQERRKLCNNTYLIRRDKDQIAVRLHATDVVTYWQDGTVDVSTGGWDTVTTKQRINAYSPMRMWSESGYMFVSANGQTVGGSSATLSPDGKLTGEKTEASQREDMREERNARNRPRNRARYWTRKARNGESYKGSVESILSEENQTVRVAKMTCYGLERFIMDAKATVVDENSGYQLLELPLDNWNKLRALKMTCPSTGAVYINTVPPHISTVADGLDFMFNVKDYLGTIGAQA